MTILPMNRLPLVAPLLLLTACATTGATLGSGVGDRLLAHPPYNAGAAASAAAPAGARVGRVPIAYQRGAAQPESFDPRSDAGSPMRALLDDMNTFLDSLGTAVRLDRAPARDASARALVPPDVRFGCVTGSGARDDDCAARGDSVLGRDGQRMLLAVGRPSAEWTTWSREAMRAGSVSRLLVITLEVGQYLPRQRGWTGSKEVELGTEYRIGLPWLTSLETPVSVLQFTGALTDSTGRALRIGAEGIHARRTRLGISALGAQEIITDDDIRLVRETRREDLPGRPLAWQAALVALLEGLTGRPVAGAGTSPR
jgi:hypothetical protein